MKKKLKNRVVELSHKMFESSFLGYGTKDLAKEAGISNNDAILLQSESPLVPLDSIVKMENTVDQIILKEKDVH